MEFKRRIKLFALYLLLAIVGLAAGEIAGTARSQHCEFTSCNEETWECEPSELPRSCSELPGNQCRDDACPILD